MRQISAIVFSNLGTGTSPQQEYKGGRSLIMTSASAYGTAVSVQVQHVDGTWITINAATISANGMTAYDLPMGQYRVLTAGGTTTALYVSIQPIPYA